MAAAYVKIYCNRTAVRTFGGNRREVKDMKRRYDNMTRAQFLAEHLRFEDSVRCTNACIITTEYHVNYSGLKERTVHYA